MVAITTLTEDFETGPNGAALSTSNSGADNVTPGGYGTFTNASPYLGTFSLNVTVSAQSFGARFDHPLNGGWRGFALKVITPDLTDTAVANWFAGATKGGDIQLTPSRRLTLRHVSNGIYNTPVLTENTWYYVTVRVSGQFRIRVYQNGSLWNDSGDLSTTASVGSLDTFRVGLISNSTARVQFDRLRGDTDTEPTPGITPPSANAVYTRQNVVEVDTSGSTGVMTLTQTSGTAATITGPVSGVFRIIPPASHTADLVFTLTATDGPSTDTETIVIPPSTVRTSEPLVLDSSGAWR